MNMTETKTEIKTVIKTVLDGSLDNFATFTLFPDEEKTVVLVIGALYENRHACAFDKYDLGKLIAELQEVYNAMEE